MDGYLEGSTPAEVVRRLAAIRALVRDGLIPDPPPAALCPRRLGRAPRPVGAR